MSMQPKPQGYYTDKIFTPAEMDAAISAEREACAKVCEAEARMWDSLEVTGRGRDADKTEASLICAAAIRARGQK